MSTTPQFGKDYGFTQEDVDKKNINFDLRGRAHARFEEIKAELPGKRKDLADWKANLEQHAEHVESKGPIELSFNEKVLGVCDKGFFDSIGVCVQSYNNAFVSRHIDVLYKSENLRAAYKNSGLVEKGEELIAKWKPLFNDFTEFLPLVRTMRMFSSAEKARALVLCKSLPKQLVTICPNDTVAVKTFMIFFEMHDFIEMWDSIGIFNEDTFERRHAQRNHLHRRYACVRATAERDRCMRVAFASLLATRTAREAALERTQKKKKKSG